MAERLEHGLPSLGRTSGKYPWHEWADGSAWSLKRGEDYSGTDHQVQRAAHEYARRYGKKVNTQTTADGLALQFWTPKKKLRIRKK